MSNQSFYHTFPRRFSYWSIHCTFNALPSLAIALVWMGLWKNPEAIIAMVAAIFTFIILYSVATSLGGPLSDDGHVISRAVKLGARIRLWISGLSLLVVSVPGFAIFTPDFWCGLLAIQSLNAAEKNFGSGGAFFEPALNQTAATFGQVYVTTMLEGFILSIVLMMISFFCVVFLQFRDRRRRFSMVSGC